MRWRDLARSDAPRLAALDALCFPAHTAFSAREFRRLLGSPGAWGRAAEEAGTIVGFVIVATDGETAEIATVDVRPDHRRQGIGRALLSWAHASMEAAGVRLATLHVRHDNAAALALYASAGYTVTGRTEGYYPGGEDALRMARALGLRIR